MSIDNIDTLSIEASGTEDMIPVIAEKKKRKVKKRKRKYYYKSTRFINQDGSISKKRGPPILPTIRKMRKSKTVLFDPDKSDVVDGQLVSKEQKKRKYGPTGNPTGKPKRVLPYEEAKEALKNEGLESAAAYIKWFNFNMPGVLAKYPLRAYPNEFKGWQDYLSIPDSRFNAFGGNKQKRFKPYKEAMAWVHTLQLKNYSEWVEYSRSEVRQGTFPLDIPLHPPIAYRRYWISWSTWLGITASAKLQNVQFMVSKKSQHILVVGKDDDDPSNVYYINVINGTLTDVNQHIARYNKEGYCNVQVLYTFDVYSNLALAKKIIATFASDNTSTSMIIHNIHQLLWELNCNFDRV